MSTSALGPTLYVEYLGNTDRGLVAL